VFGHDIHQSTRAEQLAFINWELRHTELAAGNALSRESTAYGAGGIVSSRYERPGAVAEAARNRGADAQLIAQQNRTKVDLVVHHQTGADISYNVAGASGGR
jgi:hypothetical protein